MNCNKKNKNRQQEIKLKDCWGYPTVLGLLRDDKLEGEVQLEISRNLGRYHDGESFPF
jgi:hypothetical protein